jgi:cytochrome c biogenesis protein CcmG, thiol:disulfide interchange protein DsbE
MSARTVLRGTGMALAVGFVALLVYGLTTSAPDRTIDDALSKGEAIAAPGFALAPLAGRDAPAAWRAAARDGTVELRELHGRPLVVNFWASWCDPCRAEARVLEAGWREARADGVLFVGVDTQDNREDAGEFISEFGLTFPHVRAPGRETDRRWGVTGLPETYFVDARGRVVGHVIGTVDERSLAAGIAAARAGRPRAPGRGGEQRPSRN